MIITDLNPGQKAGFSLSGTKLTIGNQVSIDLQERQKTVQNVVDVCLDNQLQTMREGLGAWYVATIIIPAQQRELVIDGRDEEGNDQYNLVERPLDLGKVELRLWALPEDYLKKEGPESEIAGESNTIQTLEEEVTE